jgi:hypothetical protein
MNSAERDAFERDVGRRALERDCVLFGSATEGGTIVFVWRSSGVQVGPEFAVRDLAIDWMARRLASEERHADPES